MSDTVSVDSEKTVIESAPDSSAAKSSDDTPSPVLETSTQEQPADAVDAPSQTEAPPPMQMSEKEPEPLPEPAPKKQKKQSLNQRMEDALSALEKERERLQSLTDRHISRERLQYLRDIGVMDQLKDSQVLALAPNADPSTPEGRASLDDFRAHNSGLFKQRADAERVDPRKFAADAPKSKNGTYGVKHAMKILKWDTKDVG